MNAEWFRNPGTTPLERTSSGVWRARNRATGRETARQAAKTGAGAR